MAAGIVDVHTHAFPDFLASRAVARLTEKGKTRAYLSGTLDSLRTSMDRAGIDVSVVCSVATAPEQFDAILRWSRDIAGPRFLPFPSVHPRSPEASREVAAVAEAGLRGIKLHPEYQGFFIDDPSLEGLYRAAEDAGLVVLFHAGYDIGFPDSDRSSPVRIARVQDSFPALRIIASHLGGFRQWEEALRCLAGGDTYLDTGYIFGRIPEGLLREILGAHRRDRLLFGSDSPWADQAEAVRWVRALGLDGDLEERILSANARALLGLP